MSGINFDFAKSLNVSSNAKTEDRPKAQFWMNIGYEVDVVVDNQPEKRFISLPMGLPLDTMKKLPATSSNAEFRALQLAQNNLLEQLLSKVATMKPGETQLVNLQIEVRRVNDEREDIPSDVNPFIKPLTL